LEGILTKDIIYKKLQNLLENIKNCEYKSIAIHSDLTESKEKSIFMNFSFPFLLLNFIH